MVVLMCAMVDIAVVVKEAGLVVVISRVVVFMFGTIGIVVGGTVVAVSGIVVLMFFKSGILVAVKDAVGGLVEAIVGRVVSVVSVLVLVVKLVSAMTVLVAVGATLETWTVDDNLAANVSVNGDNIFAG